jgi:hypothetical protein
MNIHFITSYPLVLSASFLVSACSVAQLEARLEANPQCREIVNPKTGALMPCPGSDKSFYREVGLAPAKVTPSAPTSVMAGTTPANQKPVNSAAPIVDSPTKTNPVQVDCKPKIHKKTGGTLPCPSPD